MLSQSSVPDFPGSVTSYLEVMGQAESKGEKEKRKSQPWRRARQWAAQGTTSLVNTASGKVFLLCTIRTAHQTPKLSVYTLLVKEEMTKSLPQQTFA